MNRYKLFKNHFVWCNICGGLEGFGIEHSPKICKERALIVALNTEAGIHRLAQAMANPIRNAMELPGIWRQGVAVEPL